MVGKVRESRDHVTYLGILANRTKIWEMTWWTCLNSRARREFGEHIPSTPTKTHMEAQNDDCQKASHPVLNSLISSNERKKKCRGTVCTLLAIGLSLGWTHRPCSNNVQSLRDFANGPLLGSRHGGWQAESFCFGGERFEEFKGVGVEDWKKQSFGMNSWNCSFMMCVFSLLFWWCGGGVSSFFFHTW